MAKEQTKAQTLMERLKKSSTIEETSILEDSKFFNDKDVIVTPVPALNIAFSGSICGGFTPGLTMWAGPSKHFKTSFALIQARSFLTKYPDGVILFYDSEFGAPQSYFSALGIPLDRVLHTPITDIELFKRDVMRQIWDLDRNDHVMIIVDSLGNLASKKEVEDALKESDAADMTRAKAITSVFRMITPYLTTKNIPMVVINHIYMTQEMYSKAVVKGGQGIYLSANEVYILGRQTEKDGTDVEGYSFIINIDKSRTVKEKSRIPLTVLFDKGISKYSGLLDLGVEFGLIVKPRNGYYQRVIVPNDKQWTRNQTECEEFWNPVLGDPAFDQACITRFRLAEVELLENSRA